MNTDIVVSLIASTILWSLAAGLAADPLGVTFLDACRLVVALHIVIGNLARTHA